MEVDAMTKCKGWYTKALNAPDDLLKLTEDDADVSKDEKQKIMVKTLLTLQNQLKTRKYL